MTKGGKKLYIVAPAPLVKFCLRNLFLEPILYRTTLGYPRGSPDGWKYGTECAVGSPVRLGTALRKLEMCKRRVLMLQWKIYHFSSDFRANKRKFKLSSRSRASDTFRKKFFFSWDRHAVPKEGQNLRKRSFLWWFYSEKFTIFQAIPKIFFGNWLLDASATFRLCYLYSILSMVPKIGTKG
jgi:hypothetical protein